jgi:hypothetical protein
MGRLTMAGDSPAISTSRIVIAVLIVVVVLAAAFVFALPRTAPQTQSIISSTTTGSTSTSTGNPLCTTPPCSPEITGWLHTVPGNTNVFDGAGKVIPLIGVDVDGLDFGTGNPSSNPDSCGKGWSITPSSFSNVAVWGFNSVRIPISWENLEPRAPTLVANGTWVHHWNSAYLSELDYVAGQFGQVHVAVIFDFAQVDVSAAFQQAPEKQLGGECEGWGNPIWLYPSITSPTTSQELESAMCSFFSDQSLVGSSAPKPIEAMEAAEQMLAARYSTNQAVIGIDMFNEPWFGASCGMMSHEGSLLTSFYTEMGQTIAAVNPHLLLIYEDSVPGLMPSSPIITTPPTLNNAVYEYHIYTSDWATGQPYVTSFLDTAKKAGVPIWMGEFDAFEAGCIGVNCKADQNWQADTQALLSFCNENGINWAYFSYYSLGTNLTTPIPHSQILSVLRGEIPV